jgi:hypothetical protein
MPEVLLPCNCLLSWDQTELSLIICTQHLDSYIDNSSSISTLEFIKEVANPRGSSLASEMAAKMR